MESTHSDTGQLVHDFNNVLSVILSYADFVRESPSASEQQLQDLDVIIKAGKRGTALVGQLVALSHIDPYEPEDPTARPADQSKERVMS